MKTLRTPALVLLAFATLGLGACASTNDENAESPAAEAAPMDSSTAPPPADPAAPPPADATAPTETPPPAGTP